ncbi:DNA ligase 1-like [Saccostrea echinata]|uniref:DNA ligase 1-like n=1 Tax=Saccostrea echinata TaxID=191078 RepID=UPI002A83BC6C|nr:DNA ligase 1-like [Saccostrea echinata]
MTTPININEASLETLKTIRNIGDKRAKAILEIRDRKGEITLEDLKLIPNIPSTIWDPLVEEGLIIVPSILRHSDNTEQISDQTNTSDIQTTKASEDPQNKLLEKIQELERELWAKDGKIREREILIREREDEIKEKDEELTLLHKSTIASREKADRMFEEMQKKFEMKEKEMNEKFSIRERELDEQMQRFVDQKERVQRLDEKERTEKEEQFRIRMRELDLREKEIEKRERDLRQMKAEREQEEYISHINRLAPQNVYHNGEKTEDKRSNAKTPCSPATPKLSTYDGKSEWKPYFVQFNYIAKKYMCNEKEKLDKLIECLREKALKFFSSRPENVQKDYNILCQKMKERFDKKDQPHIIRRQLQEIKQNVDETLEEFAERIEELTTEGYPDTPEYFKSTITIDAFLRGCTEKRAALVTLDKDPKTLDEAVQHMKSAITNQKLIMGPKKEVRRVTFEEKSEEIPPIITHQEDASIRVINRTTPKTVPSLETRMTALENDNKEFKRMLMEILKRLKVAEAEREPRPRCRSPLQSPTRENQSISYSPERERPVECFKCGEMGHYARNCLHQTYSRSKVSFQNRSSPQSDLNFQELRK